MSCSSDTRAPWSAVFDLFDPFDPFVSGIWLLLRERHCAGNIGTPQVQAAVSNRGADDDLHDSGLEQSRGADDDLRNGGLEQSRGAERSGIGQVPALLSNACSCCSMRASVEYECMCRMVAPTATHKPAFPNASTLRVVYVDIDIHHGDGVEEAFLTTGGGSRGLSMACRNHGASTALTCATSTPACLIHLWRMGYASHPCLPDLPLTSWVCFSALPA